MERSSEILLRGEIRVSCNEHTIYVQCVIFHSLVHGTIQTTAETTNCIRDWTSIFSHSNGRDNRRCGLNLKGVRHKRIWICIPLRERVPSLRKRKHRSQSDSPATSISQSNKRLFSGHRGRFMYHTLWHLRTHLSNRIFYEFLLFLFKDISFSSLNIINIRGFVIQTHWMFWEI
jgi:hypothetical protein